MQQIGQILLSLGGLFFIANCLILAHDFGHYATARITGVTARHFALGFGPRLVQWTDRRGTVWSLSLLPMGGYVSFPGEQNPTEKGGYLSRPPLARMAIIAAGPMANILVAIGIYAGIYTIQGMPIFLPVASSVVPGSPAAVAGFQPGDRILAVDQISIGNFDTLRPILEDHRGQKLIFAVDRHGAVLDLSATLESKTGGQPGGGLSWNLE